MKFQVEGIKKNHERGYSSDLAARIVGLNLREGLDPDTFEQLLKAFAQYPVLVFEEQFLDDDQQIEFTKLFGQPEETYSVFKDRVVSTGQKRSDFADITNVDDNGNIVQPGSAQHYFALSNKIWHVDKTFHEIPSMIGMLTARVVPSEEGTTEFADMRAAWDELDQKTKDSLYGSTVVHDTRWSRGRLGVKFTEEEAKRLEPVHQPIMRVSGRTGRTNLYLSSHAYYIVDRPFEEGRELIQRLTEHATQPKFCYVHEWKEGDVLLWDQRCTLHRTGPYDEAKIPRVLKRTGVKELAKPREDVPFY